MHGIIVGNYCMGILNCVEKKPVIIIFLQLKPAIYSFFWNDDDEMKKMMMIMISDGDDDDYNAVDDDDDNEYRR